MACKTRAIAPWYGAEPCSGMGACDNSTSLCICNSKFGGAADLFDLRVSVDGTQALDCGVQWLGVEIVWSIMLASTIFRYVCNIGALLLTLKNTKWKRWANSTLLKILLLDAFVSHPMFIALLCLKIFDDQVIGTDVAITVLFALGVPLAFFSINSFAVHQFRLLQFSSDSPLMNKYKRSAYAAPVIYFVFASMPILIALAFDKRKSPTENGLVVVLVFRIVMVCFFQIIGLRNANRFAAEAESLLTSITSTDDNHSKDKMVRVVEYMQDQAKGLRSRCFIITLLHIPFLTPWLWQSQGVLIGISMVLISLTNTGLSVLNVEWKARFGKQKLSASADDHHLASGPEMKTPDANRPVADTKDHHTGSDGRNKVLAIVPDTTSA